MAVRSLGHGITLVAVNGPNAGRADRLRVDASLSNRGGFAKRFLPACEEVRAGGCDRCGACDPAPCITRDFSDASHASGFASRRNIVYKPPAPALSGQRLLGNRLTVDPRTLTPLVLVRIQVPQPTIFLPSSWAVILPEFFDTFTACNRLSLSGTAKRASIEARIRSNVSICCFWAHSLR